MRKTFLVIMLCITTTTCLRAQAQNNKESAAVNQTITRFFDALAALDNKKMTQYVTNDLVVLENGAVWNIDTLTGKIDQLRGLSFSRINHLNFIQTAVRGTTAWVAYHNAADMTLNGQTMNVQWLESAFLVKKDNSWKIALLHSTRLEPKAQ